MGMGSRVAAVVVLAAGLAAVAAVASAAQPSPAAAAAAPAQTASKKILALLPMPARSHHIFFTVLLKALLEKGHHVTLVCSLPPTLTHPNQKVIQVDDVFAAMMRTTSTDGDENNPDSVDTFTALAKSYVGQQFLLWGIGEALTNVTLSNPQVLALRDVKHDLVITEAFFFQEALLGFADHYKAPSIVLNPFGFNLWLNDLTGGAINPSYVPNALLWMTDHMTFYERFLNTLYALFELVGYYGWYYAKQDAMLHQVFPKAPPLKELVRNISLTMVNNQAALSYPVPLAPTVLEVGGLHITPGRALPADLKKWLDDSPNGFIYFSMGSNLKASDMPKEKIDIFLTTFRSLKQKVLIKWDAKVPDNMPANFRFESWLPQQEILSHPKAVLFITHGGLLSTQESVYHGVPVVGIPIFGDQFMNMEVATRKGFGTMVSYKQLSIPALAAALDEVLHNPSYREKAQKLSNLFRSQPMHPLEKALTYIDLLFKWGNTDHLRPASLDLPWYQLILLDVFAVIFLGLYIVYRVIRGIFSLFAMCLCGSSSKPPPKKGAQRPKKD